MKRVLLSFCVLTGLVSTWVMGANSLITHPHLRRAKADIEQAKTALTSADETSPATAILALKQAVGEVKAARTALKAADDGKKTGSGTHRLQAVKLLTQASVAIENTRKALRAGSSSKASDFVQYKNQALDLLNQAETEIQAAATWADANPKTPAQK